MGALCLDLEENLTRTVRRELEQVMTLGVHMQPRVDSHVPGARLVRILGRHSEALRCLVTHDAHHDPGVIDKNCPVPMGDRQNEVHEARTAVRQLDSIGAATRLDCSPGRIRVG